MTKRELIQALDKYSDDAVIGVIQPDEPGFYPASEVFEIGPDHIGNWDKQTLIVIV